MRGAARIALLDGALAFVEKATRTAKAVISGAARTSWRPTDLYAAVMTARFHAAHGLIEQAADSLDDDGQTVIVAARTWPWLGADFVYEENDL